MIIKSGSNLAEEARDTRLHSSILTYIRTQFSPSYTISLPPCGTNSTNTKTYSLARHPNNFLFFFERGAAFVALENAVTPLPHFEDFSLICISISKIMHMGFRFEAYPFFSCLFFNVYTELINNYYTSNFDL